MSDRFDEYTARIRATYCRIWMDAEKALDAAIEGGGSLSLSAVGCLLCAHGGSEDALRKEVSELVTALDVGILMSERRLKPEVEEFAPDRRYPMIRHKRVKEGTDIESILLRRKSVEDYLRAMGRWPLSAETPLSRWWLADHRLQQNLSMQETREQCLRAWLEEKRKQAERDGRPFDPLLRDMERKEIHAALYKRFGGSVFPPAYGGTFEDFWKRQEVCRRRRGRPRKKKLGG